MDGNGRWAEDHGLVRIDGHRRGSDSVREIVTAAREAGIEALTLYAFSAQNWARPSDEVAGLMMLLYDYLERDKPTLLENQIRLNAIGDLERLPELVRGRLESVRAETAAGNAMVLTLALSYGGQEEIVAAAKRIARQAASGQLDPDAIDAALFDRALDTHGLPPVDLMIRTSGELRISNFLLWQLAYAELLFLDVQWPDFGRRDLYAAIEVYRGRQRRFGKTAAQQASQPAT
ncbi:MAG: di-trans,poly-cis-decaprenylcistransferase [Deltaproteobacteria bacterium]|nr:di-trans,poly-cis-decaprenylcistransferase [Deltaproteobacteria bacterium]